MTWAGQDRVLFDGNIGSVGRDPHAFLYHSYMALRLSLLSSARLREYGVIASQQPGR